MHTPRVPPVSIQLPSSIVTAIDAAARREDRSRSAQVRRYIREGLARDGLLPVNDSDAVGGA